MTKRVVIGGSTGLIGSVLVERLEARGDEVIRLVRSPDEPGVMWDPATGRVDPTVLEDADAVVVLNGVSLYGRRWSESRKRQIVASRVDSVGTIAGALAALGPGAPVLVAGSAIGYYGDRGDEILTEASTNGDDFLAGVCMAWEAAAAPAREVGVRVAHIRTGIVLSRDGGALKPMLPLFRLGVGGRIGDGTQWWSWISEEDIVGVIVHAIDTEMNGPVNAVAPNAVTNGVFTRTFGEVLRRPTVIPVPRIGLNIRLGSELAEAIGYASQRVRPAVLEATGYEFTHTDLESALRSALDR
ncbi:MAG: TIGR01777 family oxidoreductase [Acidimicrobiia bacterium]|nr:TIGR01777 family oxidoreductase [Acidimicrobiia bacterium]